MTRPGPLQELPLGHFNPNLRKRPLSPGSPAMYSPAKRRILSEEGIYTPKSPLSRARFKDVLMSPTSPAKKLDFGSPKQASSSRLRLTSEDEEMVDCFDLSEPPILDVQSIHYPGFRVYLDTHPHFDKVLPLATVNDKDVVKENIAPRRKTRKAATALPEIGSPPAKRRESERLKKAKSTPATPKKPLAGERVESGSPTPRRSIFGQGVVYKPVVVESSRRALQDEMDDEDCAMS